MRSLKVESITDPILGKFGNNRIQSFIKNNAVDTTEND